MAARQADRGYKKQERRRFDEAEYHDKTYCL
jgi:hypothetical protein